MAVVIFQNLTNGQHVFATLDERSGNPVHIHVDAKFDIGCITFRYGRQIDGNPRYGNALAVTHLAAVEDFRVDVFAFNGRDFQIDQAVRQEDMVTGFDILGQFFIVHRGDSFITFYVTGRQGKVMTGFHHDRAIFKLAQTDFRTFCIEQKGNGRA